MNAQEEFESPVDRVASLSNLVRQHELERCLQPCLVGAVDGLALFDRDGAFYGGVWHKSSPVEHWPSLPPEASVSISHGLGRFGFKHHYCDVRRVHAGGDGLGWLVLSRDVERSDERDAAVADLACGTVCAVLQAGYATWVTSELHLAASESSYRALTQQNSELQRAVEHLRELDKLKSNFLATVSHELRTPLTSVIGFAEMLAEGLAGPLNEEQEEYVQTILGRAEELLALITQILEMSKMEMGATELALESCAVSDLVKRALDSLVISAKQAKVRLAAEFDEVPNVVVDATKIHRVLVNLVGNAIKFSKANRDVLVRATPAPIRRPFEDETMFGEEIHDAVRFSVIDRGCGIPADQLGRIFEAFYQVDASATRMHGGAGLGLSIVRNLVEAHGGDVWVESEVHVGTTVHFTVPSASGESTE